MKIDLERSKIESHAHPAVGEFLQKLNVYKATADIENGTKFYTEATSVSSSWLKYRDIVLTRKMPRKMFVQGNTFVEGDECVFKEYPATVEGMLASYIERELF